ncbi:unnamed protein product [Victoria cruziana]
MGAAPPPSCSFSSFMGAATKPMLSCSLSCPSFLSSCFLGRSGIPSLAGRNLPPNLVVLARPALFQSRFRLCFSRRRSPGASRQTSRNRKKNARESRDNENPSEDAFEADEDALEALFSMLEEDLKNDDLTLDNDDEEITEEELAKLEQELEDALNDVEDGEVSLLQDEEGGNNEDDEEDVEPVKLKRWQLRRLASALKVGRRKTNIKSLAAELGLERAVVLELLRDPPPDLLLLSASLPDKVIQPPIEPEKQPVETAPVETDTEPDDGLIAEEKTTEPDDGLIAEGKTMDKGKQPIHILRNRWSGQKRLKKVQIETLERVYARTKRPTNAMISSIVHVTNLPWKSVLKWFEDRRALDGVPDRRVPFQRESIS